MMNLTADKSALLNALETAGRAESSKTSMPVLEGVLVATDAFEASVTGYNLETAITVCFDADTNAQGNSVLDAKMLTEIVRKMPDGSITIDVGSDDIAVITGGLSEFKLSGKPAEQFPTLPDSSGDALTLPADKLKAMLTKTTYAVSKKQNKPVFTGVLFEMSADGLTTVALDGYRLALCRESIEGLPDKKCIIPEFALKEVEHILSGGEVSLTISERHAQFQTNCVTVITRLISGEFLDYRKAMPKDNPVVLTVDAKRLLQSVERVSLLVKDKTQNPIRMTLGGGCIKLSLNSSLGSVSDVCECEGASEDMEIGFNGKYLIDALKVCGGKVRLMFKSALTPCLITPDGSDSSVHMVLPVRLKG